MRRKALENLMGYFAKHTHRLNYRDQLEKGGASAPELSFSGGGWEVSGVARVDVAAWFGADFLAWEISTVARAWAGGGGWGAQSGRG